MNDNGIGMVLKLLGKITLFIIVITMSDVIMEDIIDNNRYQSIDRTYEMRETVTGTKYTVVVKKAEPFTGDASIYKVKRDQKLMDIEIELTNNQALAEYMDEGGYFFRFNTIDGAECTYYGKGEQEVDNREAETLTDEIYLPAGRTKTIHYVVGVPDIAERIEVEYSEYTPTGSIYNTILVDL